MSKAKLPRVMVNLLNQGTVSTGLELKLVEWMRAKPKYDFHYFTSTDRPISNNRNKIVKKLEEIGAVRRLIVDIEG